MSEIGTPKIKKVKVLEGKARENAEKLGLSPSDLVIVNGDSIEKIEGDPVSYLLKRASVSGSENQAKRPFSKKALPKTAFYIRRCKKCGLFDYLDDKLPDEALTTFLNHKKYCKGTFEIIDVVPLAFHEQEIQKLKEILAEKFDTTKDFVELINRMTILQLKTAILQVHDNFGEEKGKRIELEGRVEATTKILNGFLKGWKKARKDEVVPDVQNIQDTAIEELERLRVALQPQTQKAEENGKEKPQ